MSQIRVYELAKSLNTNSRDILSLIQSWGFYVRSASSLLDPQLEKRLRSHAARTPLPPPDALYMPPRSPVQTGPTAGYDHVRYSKSRLEGGTIIRDHGLPTEAIIHAMRDKRRPPYGPVYLDFNGAEKRWAWCGSPIKIVLPEYFNEASLRACPDCLDALEAGVPRPVEAVG